MVVDTTFLYSSGDSLCAACTLTALYPQDVEAEEEFNSCEQLANHEYQMWLSGVTPVN